MTEAEYEELQYAAIAAGYKPVQLTDDGEALLLYGVDKAWNPRDVDGDAFRLMVEIPLNVEFIRTMGGVKRGVHAWPPGRGDCMASEEETYSQDPRKATRRAITRAAAEIGKQMESSA